MSESESKWFNVRVPKIELNNVLCAMEDLSVYGDQLKPGKT